MGKTILVDVDDVICQDHYFYSVNEYLEKTGRSVIKDFDDKWPYHYEKEIFKEENDLEDFYRHFLSDDVYRGTKPVPGAIEALKVLNEKHDVYLVTATTRKRENAREFTDKFFWILNHLPFFDPQKIIMINHKHLLKGDVIIDDRLKNLKNDIKTKILFTAYHNKSITQDELTAAGAVRVSDWDEVLKFLE